MIALTSKSQTTLKLLVTNHALNRGYMECRGILNITELFGIRSVRIEKQIDLVITFTEWFLGMEEERTGLETNHFFHFRNRYPTHKNSRQTWP